MLGCVATLAETVVTHELKQSLDGVLSDGNVKFKLGICQALVHNIICNTDRGQMKYATAAVSVAMLLRALGLASLCGIALTVQQYNGGYGGGPARPRSEGILLTILFDHRQSVL